jgi:hypothetical protein
MGDKSWYENAKTMLRQHRALLLIVRPPKAVRFRDHLVTIREGRGRLRDFIYMLREIRFHALFFRAIVNFNIGVVARDVDGSIEIRMGDAHRQDDPRSGDWLVQAPD